MPKSVIRISVNRLTCLDFGVSFVLHQDNKTEIERHWWHGEHSNLAKIFQRIHLSQKRGWYSTYIRTKSHQKSDWEYLNGSILIETNTSSDFLTLFRSTSSAVKELKVTLCKVNPIRPRLFFGCLDRRGVGIPAAHNSKPIHSIEIKIGRIVENRKLINLVQFDWQMTSWLHHNDVKTSKFWICVKYCRSNLEKFIDVSHCEKDK